MKATPPKIDFPFDVLRDSLNEYESNEFVKYLKTLFPVEIVERLISTYYIGTSNRWEGATVFWFINEKGGIRAGQIKHFDHAGHTRKDISPDGKKQSRTTWIHSHLKHSLSSQGAALPDWLEAYTSQEARVDCLFGEHLLNREENQKKPIALFESPKSAIIATPYFPEFLCMATGSLSYLTRERLSTLKGCNIVLYPDLSKDGSAFRKWADKAQQFSDLATFQVSDLLENAASQEEREQGLDLADYLARINYKEFVADRKVDTPPPYKEQPKNAPLPVQQIPSTPRQPVVTDEKQILQFILSELDMGKSWAIIHRQQVGEYPRQDTPESLKSYFLSLCKKHCLPLSEKGKAAFIQDRYTKGNYTNYGVAETFPFLGLRNEFEVEKFMHRHFPTKYPSTAHNPT